MSEPFLAEIRMVGFSYAPRGWAFCDGQILPINQNQSLYSLIGTHYGGDGQTTYALPDLRGRTPIHKDFDNVLGDKGGVESVTLTEAQIPAHTHGARASSAGSNSGPASDNVLAAESAPDFPYGALDAANVTPLRSGTVSNSGGEQAHDNMQPYCAVNFCIAMQGLFPTRD